MEIEVVKGVHLQRESISTVLICCDAEKRLDRGRLYRKLGPAAAASVICREYCIQQEQYVLYRYRKLYISVYMIKWRDNHDLLAKSGSRPLGAIAFQLLK